MCTIITKQLPKKAKVIGWKVVEIHGCPVQKVDLVVSPYKYHKWEPNTIHFSLHPSGFHCFANRSGARLLKRRSTFRAKIIKVILSENCCKGIVDNMGRLFDGLPAITGTKASWDGKFHR